MIISCALFHFLCYKSTRQSIKKNILNNFYQIFRIQIYSVLQTVKSVPAKVDDIWEIESKDVSGVNFPT